jgi:hypothetical protein
MFWIKLIPKVIVIAAMTVALAVVLPKVAQARDCGIAGWFFGCDQGPTEGEVAARMRAEELKVEQQRLENQKAQAVVDAQTARDLAILNAQNQQGIAAISAQNQQALAGYNAQAMQALAISNQKMAESSNAAALVAGQLTGLQVAIILGAILLGIAALGLATAVVVIRYGRQPLPSNLRLAAAPAQPSARQRFIAELQPDVGYREVRGGVEVYVSGSWKFVPNRQIEEVMRG